MAFKVLFCLASWFSLKLLYSYPWVQNENDSIWLHTFSRMLTLSGGMKNRKIHGLSLAHLDKTYKPKERKQDLKESHSESTFEIQSTHFIRMDNALNFFTQILLSIYHTQTLLPPIKAVAVFTVDSDLVEYKIVPHIKFIPFHNKN